MVPHFLSSNKCKTLLNVTGSIEGSIGLKCFGLCGREDTAKCDGPKMKVTRTLLNFTHYKEGNRVPDVKDSNEGNIGLLMNAMDSGGGYLVPPVRNSDVSNILVNVTDS